MERFELMNDEKTIIENPKHWKNHILPATSTAISTIAIIVLTLGRDVIYRLDALAGNIIPTNYIPFICLSTSLILLISIMAMFARMVDTACTRYYVTNKRVICSSGFFYVRISEMKLESIQTVNVTQKILERIFNSGDILCISAGSSLYLDDVYDARKFKQTLMEMITKRQDEFIQRQMAENIERIRKDTNEVIKENLNE